MTIEGQKGKSKTTFFLIIFGRFESDKTNKAIAEKKVSEEFMVKKVAFSRQKAVTKKCGKTRGSSMSVNA